MTWQSSDTRNTVHVFVEPELSPERSEVPFVSIAVIAYNKISTIEKCLSSLEDLDYPRSKYEVVVVDGGSTDGTVEIVRKFAVNLVTDTRKCRGVARNTAVSNCQGQIILFTDADCVPSRSWLLDHVALHRDPNVFAVAGAVAQGGDFSLPARIYHRSEFSALSPLSKRKITWEVATCNASFKRSVFTQVGPFPDLNWSEDCLLCWRILQAGYGVIFDPSPMVVHMHESFSFKSLFRKIWRQGYFDRDLQDSFGKSPPYRLPKNFFAVVLLSPSLLVARVGRYFSKFASSSSRRSELLTLPPILVAISLSWTAGYLASAYQRR